MTVKTNNLIMFKTNSLMVCGNIIAEETSRYVVENPKVVRFIPENSEIALDDMLTSPDNIMIPTASVDFMFRITDEKFTEFYAKQFEEPTNLTVVK
jgi:hypothetical protein